MIRISAIFCAVLTDFIVCSAIGAPEPTSKVKLTFIWHAGDRANLFQKIAQEYTLEVH
jgi:hypothetical protein